MRLQLWRREQSAREGFGARDEYLLDAVRAHHCNIRILRKATPENAKREHIGFCCPVEETNVKQTLFIGLRALTNRPNTEPMRASENFLIRGGNGSLHLKKN